MPAFAVEGDLADRVACLEEKGISTTWPGWPGRRAARRSAEGTNMGDRLRPGEGDPGRGDRLEHLLPEVPAGIFQRPSMMQPRISIACPRAGQRLPGHRLVRARIDRRPNRWNSACLVVCRTSPISLQLCLAALARSTAACRTAAAAADCSLAAARPASGPARPAASSTATL